jgi:CRISPR-associated protein Csd1
MLLRHLHDFAKSRKLLDSVFLQERTVHLLVPINLEGELVGNGLIPLYSQDKKGKETLGLDMHMPRFPGENNGGKAYFLAESCICLFGIDKEDGTPINLSGKKLSNSGKAFNHFWERIQKVVDATSLPALKALVNFKDRYLAAGEETRTPQLPFLTTRISRSGKTEVGANTSAGGWEKLDKATITFQVDGNVVFDADPESPLTAYWKRAFCSEAFSDESETALSTVPQSIVPCLVTGECGHPIARSHKPKILGVPNAGSGGYIVSFATECPAFSSFGFKMGENAPVSEESATSYILGLQALIDSSTNSLRIDPLLVCFWAKRETTQISFVANLLHKPDSKSVADFLKNPWVGIDRHTTRRVDDDFYSVTLSGEKARITIRHWMQTTLSLAVESLKKWFEDLEIVTFGAAPPDNLFPLSIMSLANATVRDPKKLGVNVPGNLFRASLESIPVSVSLIKATLNRLCCDLVKFGVGILETPMRWDTLKAIRDSKQPTPPSGQSRMALLKLALNRNRKEGDPMLKPEVFETNDSAYNCGRLLAVFDQLQEEAHTKVIAGIKRRELEGPGVVERYYGTASSAPNSAFGILWRLHQHHLRKLRQRDESGKRAAGAIERRIAEIASLFPQPAPNRPPEFPRTFSLVEQGRFALGFYQQKAVDDAAKREHGENKKKAEAAASAEDAPSDESN